MPEHGNESVWSHGFRPGTKACAILCSLLGVLTALCLLYLGFWKTALLAACFGVGWFVGAVRDKTAFFRGLLRRMTRTQSE